MPGKGTAKEYRRLDTLARLLEESGPCAAVCIYKDQVLIATNSIHARSRGKGRMPKSAEEVRLEKTLEYFTKVAAATDEPSEGAIILTEICKQSLKQKEVSRTTLTDGEIEALMTTVLLDSVGNLKSRRDIKSAIAQKMQEALNAYGGIKGGQVLNVLAVINDKSRDFSKLRRDFKDTGVELPLRAALLGEKKFLMLKEGEDGLHAEMRIIDYILSDTSETAATLADSIYIGISKLCCKNCHAAVEAVNAVRKDKIIEEVAPEVAAALSAAVAATAAAAREKDEQPKTAVTLLFEARGSHDLSFSWIEPKFLKEEYKTQYNAILGTIIAPGGRRSQAAPKSTSPSASTGTDSLPESVPEAKRLSDASEAELLSELQKRFSAKAAEIEALRATLDSKSGKHSAEHKPEGEPMAKRVCRPEGLMLEDEGMDMDRAQAVGSALVHAGVTHDGVDTRAQPTVPGLSPAYGTPPPKPKGKGAGGRGK